MMPQMLVNMSVAFGINDVLTIQIPLSMSVSPALHWVQPDWYSVIHLNQSFEAQLFNSHFNYCLGGLTH